jgi:hypothetical protein
MRPGPSDPPWWTIEVGGNFLLAEEIRNGILDPTHATI